MVAPGAISGLVKLYTTYEAAPDAKAGKLALVDYQSASEVIGRYGSSFVPKFVITGWVARPAELAGDAAPDKQPASPSRQPATRDALDDDIPF